MIPWNGGPAGLPKTCVEEFNVLHSSFGCHLPVSWHSLFVPDTCENRDI